MSDALTLAAFDQELVLLPRLGGGVGAWRVRWGDELIDLWRPWPGESADPFDLAHFPLVPWANRIGAPVAVEGGVHAIAPTHPAEKLPLHGEGWRQGWQVLEVRRTSATLALVSHHFQEGPFAFAARQVFTLVEGGLDQWLELRALTRAPLPHGLGLHPYFPRHGGARVRARVAGVWEPGPDLLPRRILTPPPVEADPTRGLFMEGPLLDQCYTGWDGEAVIEWPGLGLTLHLATFLLAPDRGGSPGFCHLYRPESRDFFCLEPVSHPPNAFHLPGEPGLIRLGMGERLLLSAKWRWQRAG